MLPRMPPMRFRLARLFAAMLAAALLWWGVGIPIRDASQEQAYIDLLLARGAKVSLGTDVDSYQARIARTWTGRFLPRTYSTHATGVSFLTELSDDDIVLLAGLPHLQFLEAYGLRITDQGVDGLLESRSLVYINFGRNVSAASVERVRLKLPNVLIEHELERLERMATTKAAKDGLEPVHDGKTP